MSTTSQEDRGQEAGAAAGGLPLWSFSHHGEALPRPAAPISGGRGVVPSQTGARQEEEEEAAWKCQASSQVAMTTETKQGASERPQEQGPQKRRWLPIVPREAQPLLST